MSDLEDAIEKMVENSHQPMSKYTLRDTPIGALTQSGKRESRSPSQVMRKLTPENSLVARDLGSLSIEAIIIRGIE